MSTFNLGTLQRVDLRSVWQREDCHFTPWLLEHLDLIGDVLGLELEAVGREQPVGDLCADIVARDLNRNKDVVIENQLEETDHSHLGELINLDIKQNTRGTPAGIGLAEPWGRNDD